MTTHAIEPTPGGGTRRLADDPNGNITITRQRGVLQLALAEGALWFPVAVALTAGEGTDAFVVVDVDGTTSLLARNGRARVRLLTDDDGATVEVLGDAIGFFGAEPVAQPEVPAVPTAQDVVDALVALGLVSQA